MDLQATLDPLVEKLDSWLDGAIAMLPNLTVALITLAIIVFLSRVARRVTANVGMRLGTNEAIRRLLSTIVQYTVILGGFVIALGILGLQKAVVSILAGAGVAGLAIGFAFQDLAANFIAGIAMGIRQPFQIGDMIKTADFQGHVETINLRNTILRLLDGRRVIVPNRMVFENPLINYHAHGSRRVEFGVGVAYGTPLDEATSVAREAIESLDIRDPDHDVQIVAHGFGGSSIDFLVRFWIPFPANDFFRAQHEGILAIKRAFDEHDISIPFPIRTLDFGRAASEDGALVLKRAERTQAA